MRALNYTPTFGSVAIIIPVHNEEDVLDSLIDRLNSVTRTLPFSWSYIFVNDRSTDKSLELLKEYRDSDPRIGIVTLSRCFGKENALSAGLAHTDADAVILMDADLQDPPECIPQMLEAWQRGYDVVAMKRSDRQVDSWFKRFSALGFYRIMQEIGDIPIPNDVGDFRLMSKKVVDVLNKLPEANRCMKGLFAWAGFDTIQLTYVREERNAGQSQWPLAKLIRLAVDGITSHSIAPLRIATYSGITVALAAMLLGAFTIAKTLILGEPVPGYTTILTVVAFIGGVQLLAIGVLGEYVGRTYIESKRRPIFITDEVLMPTSETKSTPKAVTQKFKYHKESV